MAVTSCFYIYRLAVGEDDRRSIVTESKVARLSSSYGNKQDLLKRGKGKG
jgi:hypothetical protein